jgi:hypothetical protein
MLKYTEQIVIYSSCYTHTQLPRRSCARLHSQTPIHSPTTRHLQRTTFPAIPTTNDALQPHQIYQRYKSHARLASLRSQPLNPRLSKTFRCFITVGDRKQSRSVTFSLCMRRDTCLIHSTIQCIAEVASMGYELGRYARGRFPLWG